MTSVMRIAALGCACVLSIACTANKAKTDVPAGSVLRVEGEVTATRDGASARPLEGGEDIFADDTIETGAHGEVLIELAHNGARLNLMASASTRIDRSVAWKAPRVVRASVLEVEPSDPTLIAGRATNREAANDPQTATGNEDGDRLVAQGEKPEKPEKPEAPTETALNAADIKQGPGEGRGAGGLLATRGGDGGGVAKGASKAMGKEKKTGEKLGGRAGVGARNNKPPPDARATEDSDPFGTDGVGEAPMSIAKLVLEPADDGRRPAIESALLERGRAVAGCVSTRSSAVSFAARITLVKSGQNAVEGASRGLERDEVKCITAELATVALPAFADTIVSVTLRIEPTLK